MLGGPSKEIVTSDAHIPLEITAENIPEVTSECDDFRFQLTENNNSVESETVAIETSVHIPLEIAAEIINSSSDSDDFNLELELADEEINEYVDLQIEATSSSAENVFSPEILLEELDHEILLDQLTAHDESSRTEHADLISIPSPIVEDLNFFQKPSEANLDIFFTKHPIQPTLKDLPFNGNKVYFKNNDKRKWISYNVKNKKVYCSVCLAFGGSSEANSFMLGQNDWRHIHVRISEHEKSVAHNKHAEQQFLRNSSVADINSLVVFGFKNLRQKQIQFRRDVLQRIIHIIKVLGKRGQSLRGNKNESAYSLEDHSLDHGNFLELVILLSAYDSTMKLHLDEVIKQSKEHKGTRGRGTVYNFDL